MNLTNLQWTKTFIYSFNIYKLNYCHFSFVNVTPLLIIIDIYFKLSDSILPLYYNPLVQFSGIHIFLFYNSFVLNNYVFNTDVWTQTKKLFITSAVWSTLKPQIYSENAVTSTLNLKYDYSFNNQFFPEQL